MIRVTYQGRTQSIAAWARELGLPSKALYDRLSYGWSVERALSTPLDVAASARRRAAVTWRARLAPRGSR